MTFPVKVAMLAVLVLGAVAVLLACGGSEDPSSEGVLDEMVVLGASVYATTCAACHGERGEGEPGWQSRRPDGTLPAPPHDSSGHTWHHTDAVLMEIITVGGQAAYGGPGITSAMPAFRNRLTDDEIAAVLGYIKSLWGDDERAYQRALR
jgi:mono/diheme cytochrome c family protein